jgi:hypothetical protein
MMELMARSYKIMIYYKLKKRMSFPMILGSILLLISCGGGGGGGGGDGAASDISPQKKAYFIDSGVSNLAYSSLSHKGFTDEFGGFLYKSGETTTFSAFGLILGTVTPVKSGAFTPLDLFPTTDVNNQSVKNVLVFLQSLDTDQIPGNGISLSWEQEIKPDFSSLDITNTAFQSNLGSAINDTGNAISLVLESDALEHFENTIIKLNAPTILEGRWINRDTENGDVNAVYTFSENDTLTITEFESCPDNEGSWISTETYAKRYCRENDYLLTTDLKGKELTMTGDKFSDSCTIISSSSYLIEAGCEYEGSESGTEFTRFERDITQLNNKLVANKYRELQGGTISYTKLTFNPNLTGSYHYINNGGKVTDEDTGDFTWKTSPSALAYTGTDGSGESFTGALAFVEDVQGAWKSETSGDTNNETSVLIPDFDDSLVNIFLNYSRFMYVYDAIKGNCKSLYEFSSGDEEDISGAEEDISGAEEDSPMKLHKHPNNVEDQEVCDEIGDFVTHDEHEESPYTVFINETNGAFVIEDASNTTQEICWPISYFNTASNGGGIVAFLACSINDQPFKFEIWRSL